MTESLVMLLSNYARDPRGFEEKLVHPVLLYEPVSPEKTDEQKYQVKTISGTRAPRLGGSEPLVVPVQKCKENAFQRGITVGRTNNNDIVLDDPSVSRFHAWFYKDETTGAWTLIDAGSKNGTMMAGSALKPKVPQSLLPETRVRFGSIDVRFFHPSEFIKFLKK